MGAVLLVEIERQRRPIPGKSASFPFLLGLAVARGLRARWVVLCVSGEDARSFPKIPEETLQAFSSLLDEFKPRCVVFSETPGESLWDIVEAHGILGAVGMPPNAPLDEALEALGLPIEAGSGEMALLETVSPLWDHEFLGPPPTSRVVEIVTGPICGYQARLDRNPFFRGIELSRASTQVGCSFCLSHKSCTDPKVKSNVVDLAIRQFACAVKAHGDKWPGRVVFVGWELFATHLDRLFEQIMSMQVPPTEFAFFCRLDEVVRQAHLIEKLLPLLHQRGHALSLFSMGVENFSPTENLRFNKGLSINTIREASLRLRAWTARYPGTLRYQQGGYSFIMFTPWTSGEDVRINLELARELELKSDFFASRLVMTQERPITLLAEKDGLLADDFEDPAFWRYDSGCLRPGEKEIPWRFQHKEIAALYGVYVRMCAFGISDSDDASRRVQAWMAEYRGMSKLDLAQLALKAALSPQPVGSLMELLERLEQSVAENRMSVGQSLREHPSVEMLKQLVRDAELDSDFTLDGVYESPGRVELAFSRGDDAFSIWLEPFDPKRPHFRVIGPIAIGHTGEPTPALMRCLEHICTAVARAAKRDRGCLDNLARALTASALPIVDKLAANRRNSMREEV